MSGVRGLFGEAGRAAAFVRRLEQSLAPARRAVSASADLVLLRIDERLSGLTDPVDVSSALDAVMARLAVTPAGDQFESHAGRRAEGGARAYGEPRHSIRPDEASPSRRHAARSRQTAAGEASAALRQSSNAIVPPRNSVAAASERPAASRAVVRPRAANAAAAATLRAGQASAAEPLTPGPVVLRASAAAVSRVAAASVDALAPGTVDPIPFISASHATAILSERMRASDTLQAFRSVVRVPSSAQSDPARPGSIAVVGRTLPAEPSASSAPHLAGGFEIATPRESAAVDARTMSDRVAEAAPAGRRRAPAPVVDSTLSGLRRLAALATASLDDPRPAVEPVSPSTPVVGVEEELDRILRAEALRYGIRADGLVR